MHYIFCNEENQEMKKNYNDKSLKKITDFFSNKNDQQKDQRFQIKFFDYLNKNLDIFSVKTA